MTCLKRETTDFSVYPIEKERTVPRPSDFLFTILKWKSTLLFKGLVNTVVPFRRIIRWAVMGTRR